MSLSMILAGRLEFMEPPNIPLIEEAALKILSRRPSILAFRIPHSNSLGAGLAAVVGTAN